MVKGKEKEFITLIDSAIDEYITLARPTTDTIKKLEKLYKSNNISSLLTNNWSDAYGFWAIL